MFWYGTKQLQQFMMGLGGKDSQFWPLGPEREVGMISGQSVLGAN